MMNWLKTLMPLILADFLKKVYNAKIKDIEDKYLALLTSPLRLA